MALASGTKLGPYEVQSPLGVGGMGEVYRARDTKLGRDVALKVLPQTFVNDAERMARFESPGSRFIESPKHRLHLRPGRFDRRPRPGDGTGRRGDTWGANRGTVGFESCARHTRRGQTNRRGA